MKRFLVFALAAIGCTPGPMREPPVTSPATTADYLLFVASEGNDEIALVRFDGAAARVERVNKITANPTELMGPHGITVSPDGRFYYVTAAHGAPNGALLKYAAADDAMAGRVELGRFPATSSITPDGHYIWVVNFNL